MTTLLIAEHDNASLKDSTNKALTAAAALGADVGVDLTPRLEVLKTTEPAGRKAGVKVKDVAELVSKLKTEAGVL